MQNFIKSLVALVSLPLFCGCQAVFFRTLNSRHAEIAPTTQVYAAEHDLRVDVYRPPHAAGSTPVVLFFYGGSWRTGARGEYAFVGRALASRGVLTIIADYRKYPQGAFPRFEEDAASAARWTVDHVAQFGGDPTRIFLTGHSAGAQIATLLATDKRYLAAQRLRPADFAGAIGVAGPYDFLPLTDPKLIEVFGPESQWPASQPIRFVDGDEPPFLLLQGSGDRIVEPRNASAMETTLRAAHVPVTSRLYPGVGHFRILAGLRFTALAPTLDDIVAFIEATPPVQK
jgi:acetyl esterase/lipase